MKKVTGETIEFRVVRVLAHCHVTLQSTTGMRLPSSIDVWKEASYQVEFAKTGIRCFCLSKASQAESLTWLSCYGLFLFWGRFNICAQSCRFSKVDSRFHYQEDRTSILRCAVGGLTTATMLSLGSYQTSIEWGTRPSRGQWPVSRAIMQLMIFQFSAV